MAYLYLVLFAFAVILHLCASLKKDRKLRNTTKPVLLFSLLAFYINIVPNPSIYVILAIILSWIGDLLLMAKGVGWFAAGGIFFLGSHVFFILSYINQGNVFGNSWYIYLIFGSIFLFASIFVFVKMKPHLPKMLFFPMTSYLLVNGAMNCFAIFRFFAEINHATSITVLGALLFFISDALLFFVRFNKNSKIKSHFTVMLTYSIAELLIVVGLI